MFGGGRNAPTTLPPAASKYSGGEVLGVLLPPMPPVAPLKVASEPNVVSPPWPPSDPLAFELPPAPPEPPAPIIIG